MEATGKVCRRENKILYNPIYPFAHANIDRLVLGGREGLECKTTSTLDLRKFQSVEFPEQYYVQCVHYLAVTGLERWHLAVLVYGKGFYTYTLERNQAEIDALMAAEAAFWKMVEADTPPVPDGEVPTTDTLKTLFRESSDGTVDLFGRESVLREYFNLKEQQTHLEARMSEIENLIKADMKDASSGRCGNIQVSWKSQTRRTFQTKAHWRCG